MFACCVWEGKTGGRDDITQIYLCYLFLCHKYCGPSHMKLKTRDALQQELELKEHFLNDPVQLQSFSWVALNI